MKKLRNRSIWWWAVLAIVAAALFAPTIAEATNGTAIRVCPPRMI